MLLGLEKERRNANRKNLRKEACHRALVAALASRLMFSPCVEDMIRAVNAGRSRMVDELDGLRQFHCRAGGNPRGGKDWDERWDNFCAGNNMA